MVHMKTISSLRKHEELEELQDELVTQLLDYQQCKRMAQMVKDRLELGTFVRERMKLKKDLTYRGHHDTEELLTAYQTAVGKGKAFFAAAYGIFFSHCCNAYCICSLQNDSCAALFMERA